MISFPFDNKSVIERDRAISSDIFADYLKRIIGTNGIFAELGTKGQVTPKSDLATGLDVIVKPVDGFIEGRLFVEKKEVTLHLGDPAELPQIFTVAVRLNKATRDIQIVSIAGEPASEPQPPALVRESGVYDIGLANVRVERLAETVEPQNITDTRLNSSICGLVPIFGSVDTTTLYNQIEAELKKFKATYETDFINWRDLKKSEFETFMTNSLQTFQTFMYESGATFDTMIVTNQNTFDVWFEDVKSKLGSDPAGQLMNEINNIKEELKTRNVGIKVLGETLVQPSLWQSDSTFVEFPYKATLSYGFIDADWWCEILTPDRKDLSFANALCPYVETGLKSFSIWSKVKFSKAVKLENAIFETEVKYVN